MASFVLGYIVDPLSCKSSLDLKCCANLFQTDRGTVCVYKLCSGSVKHGPCCFTRQEGDSRSCVCVCFAVPSHAPQRQGVLTVHFFGAFILRLKQRLRVMSSKLWQLPDQHSAPQANVTENSLLENNLWLQDKEKPHTNHSQGLSWLWLETKWSPSCWNKTRQISMTVRVD